MYKDFWLYQSNQLVWRNKPKVPLIIKKDNTPYVVSRWEIEMYSIIFLNKKNQIAIYFFDKNKKTSKVLLFKLRKNS